MICFIVLLLILIISVKTHKDLTNATKQKLPKTDGLKFTGPIAAGFTMDGCRLLQGSSKAKDDRRTPGNTADDLGQPASETN